MGRVRNHVHYIFPPDSGVAKGTEEIEEKAKAEVKQPDPVSTEAKVIVEGNVIATDVKIEATKAK